MKFCIAIAVVIGAAATALAGEPANLAFFATPVASFLSEHETLDALHDGFEPQHSGDHRHGAYCNWPRTGTQWVEYHWSRPISTDRVDVYWWADGRRAGLPVACRLLYWDGRTVSR
jgi:uncharacterized protein